MKSAIASETVSAPAESWSVLLCQTMPELRAGTWQLLDCYISEERKQRRKRIVFCVLSYRAEPYPAPNRVDVVVKVYGSDRGEPALQAMRELWRAGFRPPATHRVPQPYGYSRERASLVQARAPGEPWSERLDDDLAAARASEWLVALHRSDVAAAAPPVGDATAVRAWTQELLARYPREARPVAALTEILLQRLEPGAARRMPSHGDYHPKNVFVAGGSATVVDFDTFALRDPAFDLGYAIGHLLILSHLRRGDLGPGARSGLAFWRRYTSELEVEWTRVAAQVARTLLQALHYDLCTLANERIGLLGVWPELMAEWLACGGPEILEGLGRGRRVAAPLGAGGA